MLPRLSLCLPGTGDSLAPGGVHASHRYHVQSASCGDHPKGPRPAGRWHLHAKNGPPDRRKPLDRRTSRQGPTHTGGQRRDATPAPTLHQLRRPGHLALPRLPPPTSYGCCPSAPLRIASEDDATNRHPRGSTHAPASRRMSQAIRNHPRLQATRGRREALPPRRLSRRAISRDVAAIGLPAGGAAASPPVGSHDGVHSGDRRKERGLSAGSKHRLALPGG